MIHGYRRDELGPVFCRHRVNRQQITHQTDSDQCVYSQDNPNIVSGAMWTLITLFKKKKNPSPDLQAAGTHIWQLCNNSDVSTANWDLLFC